MSEFEFSPNILKTLEIESMTCGHCKMKIEKALNELAEVELANVDLIDGIAEVKLNKDIDKGVFEKVLKEIGYTLKEVR